MLRSLGKVEYGLEIDDLGGCGGYIAERLGEKFHHSPVGIDGVAADWSGWLWCHFWYMIKWIVFCKCR